MLERIFAIAAPAMAWPAAGAAAAQQDQAPAEDKTAAPPSEALAQMREAVLGQDPEELIRRGVLTLIVLAVAIGLRVVVRRMIERAGQRLRKTAEEFTPLSERAKQIESGAKKLVTIALVLLVAGVLLAIWGLSPGDLFAVGGDAGRRATTAVVIFAVAWLLWYGARIAIEFLLLPRAAGPDVQASARTRTLVPLFIGVIRVVIAVMAALLILSELGLDIAPLLAGAGIAGLAIGFGAQSVVKDFLTGAFIILEDAVAVGEVATVAGHTGLVEGMGVRTMRLRDLAGTVHTVPYGEIGSIENFTKDYSYALMDIGVAYRENVDRVIEVMQAVAEEQRGDPEFAERILEPLEVLGVNQFGDSAVVIRVRIKTKPIEQWGVMRNYYRRLKQRFDEEGIEIPFPHRTLYFGIDKQGEAPPMRMNLDEEALARLGEGRTGAGESGQ